MTKPAPIKAVRAWAVIDKAGNIATDQFDGLQIYNTPGSGERVIPVQIVPVEEK